jgi:hypothetical protein
LLAREGGDLQGFYAAARELGRGPPGPRRELCAGEAAITSPRR